MVAFKRFLTLTITKQDLKYKPLYKKIIVNLIKYLCKCCSQYKLVPELGENGRLHFHIELVIKDPVKYKILLNYWQTTYGFIKNEEITGYRKKVFNVLTPEELSKINLNVYMNKERLLHAMGYKYHIITNETQKFHIRELKEEVRSSKQYNKLTGIEKYFL